MLTIQLSGYAKVIPSSFLVKCEACHSELTPPETEIGRKEWMASELNRRTVCDSCGHEMWIIYQGARPMQS